MKYKKGTQEMLDAAKDDATLLPFGVKFKTNGIKNNGIPAPVSDLIVYRSSVAEYNDFSSVRVTDETGEEWYVRASQLSPMKRDKPKKWQNGTQQMLDAAKDDARLIPKKTYFLSKYGATNGLKVYRIDSQWNESKQVMMFENNGEFDYHNASDLEPIND